MSGAFEWYAPPDIDTSDAWVSVVCTWHEPAKQAVTVCWEYRFSAN